MDSWEKIAESRIEEWLHRPAHQRTTPADGVAPLPLELQILEEVLNLYSRASSCPDTVEREALIREAGHQEIRLFTLLENSGKPLAAQHLGKILLQARAHCRRNFPK